MRMVWLVRTHTHTHWLMCELADIVFESVYRNLNVL